ncbi:MAG: tRNA (adenosine(37)-N6)-dimethylallyltransferase MiaA [bacterium]|nr:tRNA (adenosine(37)-N6)-dimethylallyltransferase MiaA [bacterium]
MIIIAGQTGTGKTTLALDLAIKYNGELISADSRQIYTGMDIGTGKVDSVCDLTLQDTTWMLKGIPIHGINLIAPSQIFSAGDFAEYGREIISNIEKRGKTPILVGGTGFYIKSLIDPDDTVFIPQNKTLRSTLEQLSSQELQDILKKKDNEKLQVMNNSDRNNPRRLVRAIEVAEWKTNPGTGTKNNNTSPGTIQWIGLSANKTTLESRISGRINKMLDTGLEDEVRILIEKYGWDVPGLQTIGYKEWKSFLAGEQTIEDVKKAIVLSHLQYSRKQMIYLKRFPDIKWQEVTQP